VFLAAFNTIFFSNKAAQILIQENIVGFLRTSATMRKVLLVRHCILEVFDVSGLKLVVSAFPIFVVRVPFTRKQTILY